MLIKLFKSSAANKTAHKTNAESHSWAQKKKAIFSEEF
jgi:hypothetical protein